MLVSVTREVPWQDPLAFFAAGAGTADRVFWAAPGAGWALAGVGAAHTLTAPDAGPARFVAIDAAWPDLLADARIEADPAAPAGGGPLALGGFAFDPARPTTPRWAGFPPARLVVHRRLLRATATRAWLTTNAIAEGETMGDGRWTMDDTASSSSIVHPSQAQDPSSIVHRPAFEEQVAAAVAAIRAGGLEKVVLARSVTVEGAAPFDPAAVLGRLRAGYPTCYVFAVARGGRCFLGASPEQLVRAAGGQVAVACLAGSTARGSDPADDARRGAALLASAKDRHEHALVAAMLQTTLAAVCTEVTLPATPQVLCLPHVQHLYTPVTARLAPGRRLLDLVARLHPTPAVGGSPRPAALAWLRAHEDLDRGWYAGPVGWLDAQGDGDFAVALRSGLLDGAHAYLFAGCGIVANSDPATEYAESELKLRAMRMALCDT